MKFLSRFLRKADRLWQVWLAHGFRATGWKILIMAFHGRRNILLSVDEMDAVAQTIRRRPGRLLVFGAGYDSIFWTLLNRNHLSIFLEADDYWRKRIGSEWKSLILQSVRYTTKLADLHAGEECNAPPPPLDLPELIRKEKWDIILVDAPQGWGDGPGRSQSIHEASQLIAPGGHLFIHDCDREAERYLAGRYLREFCCHKLTDRLWMFSK
jgi:hypothetical protein